MNHTGASSGLSSYSLMDALLGRRSHRFGLGMKIEHGPLTYASQHPPMPLSEDEEAALVFAAAGITGYALRDVPYGEPQGGAMIAGAASRVASSPDAINCVPLFVTNDNATYLIKRPQDFAPAELPELLDLARRGALTELYRKMRVKIKDGRAAPPLDPPMNIKINRWDLYQPGCTYFLPVNDLTYFYINGMLEIFEQGMQLFVIDERANLRPAGVARFGRTQGGELFDRLEEGRTVSVSTVETSLIEFVAIEAGMMLQNLGLMAQAMGLGAFPCFARHESGWFEALGFKMAHMPASRYIGANPLITAALGLLKRDPNVPYPVGLEHDGQVLIKPYCPPYYPSMREAVLAVVDSKFGPRGIYRGQANFSCWRDGEGYMKQVQPPRDEVIEAVIAYCEYIYNRYGRFPAYVAPYRTVTGYQAHHVDVEFYDKFYQPEALTENQREHMRHWHAAPAEAAKTA